MQKKRIIYVIIGIFLLISLTISQITGIEISINHPPNIPDEPSGPSMGLWQAPYVFSTRTSDPDNNRVKYGWDFDGDLIIDWWTDFYRSGNTMYIATRWLETGTYDIRVMAEDIHGAQSDFSSPHSMFIDDGSTLPSIPRVRGSTSGKVDEVYEFTFVSTDPNGYNIYYKIEWGDGTGEGEYGWIGPYSSGETITLTHTWNKIGKYNIHAIAKNINGYFSDPGTLPISISRIKINKIQCSFLKNYPVFYYLLERLLKI
jgi:hypothetical protein